MLINIAKPMIGKAELSNVLRALPRLHLAGQQDRISPRRNCTSRRSNPQWWVDFWATSSMGGEVLVQRS